MCSRTRLVNSLKIIALLPTNLLSEPGRAAFHRVPNSIKIFLAAALLASGIGTAFGQSELMVNGGFELFNLGEWQISGTGAFLANGPGAASGMGYLTMGNVAGVNQVAYQTITFPTNLISAVFGFNYEILTTDTSGLSHDTLSVYVLDANRNALAFLGTASNLNPTSGYGGVATNLVIFPFQTNLTQYAGKTVEVYFQVTTDPQFGAQTTFNLDNVSMLIGTTADIPANDNFSNSVALATNSATTSVKGTNTFASKEPGEPNIAGNRGGHSVWWNWTAPGIGTVTISTSGSSFTTLLGVYTGSTVSNVTPVAANNGNSRGGPAQVTFNVTPGTQYQIGVDGYNGQAGTIALSLKFSLDTKVPTVSISTPASGAKLTNSMVVVQGKATDNVGVALVQVRLENAAGTNDYQAATGTNNWTATVTNLIPGPNTIRARAIDTSGNVSATATRAVTFIVVSPLTVAVSGNGTVAPNLSGHLLPVGSTFTLTVKPGAGYIFAGWTGDYSGDAPTVKFTMLTNMTLQANFIPNPFIPVAGVYQGLFYDTNGAAHQSSGFVNATITSAGAYSAKVFLAGGSYSLSGRFHATGAASNSIAARGQGLVSVQLELDLSGWGLSGQLSNGTWTSELNAYRSMTNAPTGSYTLALPASQDSALPGGDSFGTVTVGALGSVTLAATLGDGTKVTQKTIVTPDGGWPFYASLYSANGSILGWLDFSDPASDITGPVSWFKLAQPGKFYPAGFTNQNNVIGSRYKFTNGVPVLGFGSGEVRLANGNLAGGVTNQISLSTANKVSNQSSNALTVTITTASGLFKGTVVDPVTRKSIAINGVVLQKQGYGAGVFLGTNQTGQVYFGP